MYQLLCSYSQHIEFSEYIYTSGCRQQHVCKIHDHGGLIIGKRDAAFDQEDDFKQGYCQQCCTGDLCDTNCTLHQNIVNGETFAGYDCKEILEKGRNPISGIYNITLPQSGAVIPVYCDMDTDGGGWTVFQNRYNGNTDFYRNMSEYVNGFGDLRGEFWLGLKYIKELSTYCPEVDLRLDLVKADGTAGHETFSNFSLSPAPEYMLHLNPGNGTLGDSNGMSYSKGFNFYTFDHENSYGYGCAVKAHGGWWYGNCANANLNGEYLHPPGTVSSIDQQRGMRYHDFDGLKSLKSSKMMMRRHISRKC